ncbi:MAG: TIGR03663 family protein [Anaerolineales bacterium]|nr:TIGR03663 family protein [Anaerolineales bacterium]
MQPAETLSSEQKTSWLDRPILNSFTLSWETILFVGILLLVIFTRFYDLEPRVMSHDETTHVFFSWRLYRGDGYAHDPMTHGPLQFHLVALSYFLFGDNDASARVPAVLVSIAAVAFLWNYRRYLGRAGILVAAFLFLISPYLLYYSRYVRNEALVVLFGVMMIWAILRYLETGSWRYIYWLTAATILHYTAKETAFIYTAQALIFLALFFIGRVLKASWVHPEHRTRFLIALIAAFILLGAAGGVFLLSEEVTALSPTETAPPAIPGQETPEHAPTNVLLPIIVLGVLTGLALLVAAFFLVRGYTLTKIRSERSFDLLILLGTLVLPMLSPFPVYLVGWNPLDYSTEGLLRTAVFLIPMVLIAIAVGLWWNPRLWLINAAVFYGVFTILYTTIFTNGNGFFTGLVGSLGYWLEQHGETRGNQPWYYYLFVQIPVYEYLAALGSLLAFYYFGILRRIQSGLMGGETDSNQEISENSDNDQPLTNSRNLAFILLGFWVISSILAYSIAGEKMPWLTVHIAFPMALLAGWGFGHLIESIDWTRFRLVRGVLIVIMIPIFLISMATTLGYLFGPNQPFQGTTLEQLQITSGFMSGLIITLASGFVMARILKTWPLVEFTRMAALTAFALLALLTIRTAIRATYINYDYATEYLVYAHSGHGPKEALAQIEEISRRTTDGLGLVVAYDNQTTYPFWWYFRNFENQRYYGSNPTRDLREAPIILVGDQNYGRLEPIVGQAYHQFDYIRLWWPNQDYFNLTWERIWNAISTPEWRAAIFQIWFNRDYTLYGELTGRDMTLPNWEPSARMRMYIRKDITAQLWNYGAAPAPEDIFTDPYENKELQLFADMILGNPGQEPGNFQGPRGLAIAPDGSIFIADTANHRIQQINRDGSPIAVWGSFSGSDPGAAPPGTFNEPWGIAIGPDGSVFVADTWNHRIQKFSPQGEFITMWGYFGQAESPLAFWGPRDVAINAEGHILITDTGNKRVVIFDSDGNFINQFGSSGFAPGQFDEPVGMAIDDHGRLFIADTWNQRIQVFEPDGFGNYRPLTSWEVYAWFGSSLDNKPFLAVDQHGRVFATDPEGYRVLVFTPEGEIINFWGDYGISPDSFGLTGAVATDPLGGVWISDTGNSRIMRFTLPED